MADTLKPLIEKLCARTNLSRAEAEAGVRAVIAGVDHCQTAAFLVLLKAKGETPEEIAGMVTAMRSHMLRVETDGPTIDIVGTGGDGFHTVNFSTCASLVVAACGVKVAKHGNRSVSSQCGSADVLEELGIKIAQPPAGVEACLKKAGIAFMFAPSFHPAMKNVVPVRKALGVRTVFNILGPLLNPAAASRMVIGVYAEEIVPLMAHALHALGAEHVMVIHCGGLDELAPIVRPPSPRPVAYVPDLAPRGGGHLRLHSTLSCSVPKLTGLPPLLCLRPPSFSTPAGGRHGCYGHAVRRPDGHDRSLCSRVCQVHDRRPQGRRPHRECGHPALRPVGRADGRHHRHGHLERGRGAARLWRGEDNGGGLPHGEAVRRVGQGGCDAAEVGRLQQRELGGAHGARVRYRWRRRVICIYDCIR